VADLAFDMAQALFLESVAGVAGDMFAAAFVDAGLVSREELAALPAKLGFSAVEISVENTIRATMRAAHLAVRGPQVETHLHLGHDAHHHTNYRDIKQRVENSTLETPVKELAQRIFRLLAEAEADAHGVEVEQVAFHEVGTVDSLADVVMAAYCVVKVNAQRIYATPAKPGRGIVMMLHGAHPIPPPASARLLLDMPTATTPAAVTRENIELSTPTGLAILKALSPIFVTERPAGIARAQGAGAGTLDLGAYPNIFRVTLLEETDAPALPYETDTIVEIACNIDDDTAERIAWLCDKLLQNGALDVWQAPVTGKKGRAAVCLTVLAAEGDWAALADWLLRHSATFGVRYKRWDRLKLAREFVERDGVTYKIGRAATGEFIKEKAEFESARQAWERGG
jgi:hypothetical protein